VVASGDLGQSIKVTITETNTAGSASATSSATATVTGAVITPPIVIINMVPTISGATITGSPVVGQTLSAVPGTVTGSPTPSATYQWSTGAGPITGATGPTYVVASGDLGQTITVTITEISISGSASATSSATATVTAPPAPPVPVVTITSPTGGGTYALGQSVTTSFSCTSASGAPAIATCTDGLSSSGTGVLDTSSAGVFTYTVTGTSTTGQVGTASISYTVTSPPIVHPKPVPRTVSTVLYYSSNSWALTPNSKHVLDVLAHEIQAHHLTTLNIDGYASSSGTQRANQVVAANRANAVASYLKALLARLHVRGVTVQVRGYGASHFAVKPYDSPQNRRTTIVAK
ncbi:MAG: OmpA family protein, partial [Acidimicrobiaceae bacterium]|nr:OmpA family protein [Acidimicrobiaceae bacterium]